MTAKAEAANPRLSVLVPSWNGRDLLPGCLASVEEALLRSPDLTSETVVVDDGSTDDSAAFLAERFPRVRVLALGERGGFIRAVNAGVSECVAEWLLLINNDVRLDPDFFMAALPHLDKAAPGLFAVAPRLVTRESGNEIDESLYAPRMRFGKLEVVPRTEAARETGAGVGLDHGGPDRAIPRPRIYYACGAACFLRRSFFLDLGGFDDLFSPFFWEDVDLSLRALARGLSIVHEPASVAHHIRSATIRREGDSKRLSVYFRNQEAFFWKHASGVRLITTHAALLPFRWLKAVATGDLALALGLLRTIPLVPGLARRRRLARRSGNKTVLSRWVR